MSSPNVPPSLLGEILCQRIRHDERVDPEADIMRLADDPMLLRQHIQTAAEPPLQDHPRSLPGRAMTVWNSAHGSESNAMSSAPQHPYANSAAPLVTSLAPERFMPSAQDRESALEVTCTEAPA